jgi:hypothetical protein
VVDLDSLPGSSKDSAAAADALNRIRERVEILYITDKLASEPAAAHDFLARLHYPDSAVIPAFTKRDWLRKYEMRTLPSMIVLLKSRLGDLRYGITSDADMAKAMQQAALELIFVGKGAPRGVFGVQDFGHLELPLAQQPGGPMPPISSQPAE